MVELQGMLGSLGSGINLSGVTSGFIAVLAMLARIILIIAPITVFGYFIYRRRQYPIDVHIFSQRGKNITISKDRMGRFISPTGIEKHKFASLRRKNQNINPIPFDRIYLSNRGKPKAFLAEIEGGYYYPMAAPDINPAMKEEFEIIKSPTKVWRGLMLQEALTRYSAKKWYQEYFPHISFMLLAIFIIVLFALVKGDLAAVAQASARAAEALGRAAATAPATGAPGW